MCIRDRVRAALMNPLGRLLALLAPLRGRLALCVLFGAGALISGLALVAVASYLISKAAVVTDVAALTVAFAAVRAFAIAKAGLRYEERYTAHSLSLRVVERLRTWFYAAVEPSAPASLSQHRSGCLLYTSPSPRDRQ